MEKATFRKLYLVKIFSVFKVNLIKRSQLKTIYLLFEFKIRLRYRRYRNSNEHLLSIHDKEKGLLEKDKKSAGIAISELKRALLDKEKENEYLIHELKR